MKKNRFRVLLQFFIGGSLLFLLSISCSSELGVTKNPNITVNYIAQPGPENLNSLLSQYRNAIRDNEGMPGIRVDYAVLLLKAGKKEEALKQFDAEIKLFPESQKYVELLKSNLQ